VLAALTDTRGGEAESFSSGADDEAASGATRGAGNEAEVVLASDEGNEDEEVDDG